MTILDLKITNRPVAELVPYAQNARVHSDRQIQNIVLFQSLLLFTTNRLIVNIDRVYMFER